MSDASEEKEGQSMPQSEMNVPQSATPTKSTPAPTNVFVNVEGTKDKIHSMNTSEDFIVHSFGESRTVDLDSPTQAAASNNEGNALVHSFGESRTVDLDSPTKAPKSTSKTSSTTNNTPSSSTKSKLPSYLIKSGKGKLTYVTMIHEAIVTLGDRTGSSQVAIANFLKSNYPHVQHTHSTSPSTFKTSLSTALRSGIKETRFVKVKASFKINTQFVKKEKAKWKTRENNKKMAEKKRVKEREKVRLEKKEKEMEEKRKEAERKKKLAEEEEKRKKMMEMTEEEKAKMEEKRLAKEAAEKKKAEAAARAKEIAERIRKRKFPMDDLELIAEDKELGVKRPAEGVSSKQPHLPYAMLFHMPHEHRPTSKKTTPVSVMNACTSNEGVGSRSCVSDIMQVYNFFCGDVGYTRLFPEIAPKFTLKHLMYAVQEVVWGNSKKSRALPSLISHLFLVALKTLTSVERDENEEDMVDEDEADREHNIPSGLTPDLQKLNSGLCEASWGEVLYCYLDMMERFYTSDESNDPNALPGYPIILDYEDDVDNDKGDNILTNSPSKSLDASLPEGYQGYLGDTNGPLCKAYMKLSRNDPWCLAADELMAVLRALTDDIMSMKADLARDIAERDEQLYNLLKEKKAAESHFRKIRLAYEGPKFPNKNKKKEVVASNKSDNGDGSNKADGDKEETVAAAVVKKFKPTATKKQFDAADKARTKAFDAYEKGLKKLIARSEPIGSDRNHNAFYFFNHDPDTIFVEVTKQHENELKSIQSWHIIDNKSLFDDFISSLDVRGIRESNLYEDLTGGQGSISLKRYLFDDNKKKNMILARKREEEALEKKLEKAKHARAVEEAGGRRSGRLALSAKDDLVKIEEEIKAAARKFEVESMEAPPDYRNLTGLDLISEFELKTSLEERCSKLWNDDNNENNGIAGMMVSKLLSLEDHCNELSPWEREDLPRGAWQSSIRDVANAWERGSSYHLGPKANNSDQKQEQLTPRKRRKSGEVELKYGLAGSTPSTAKVLTEFKGTIIDLESRIFSVTGLERAVKATDEANDNVSVVSSASNNDNKIEADKVEKSRLAWKKKIFTLHSIPTKRSAAIRETLITAIAMARKGDLNDEVDDLRAALKLHRPGAAGRAKSTALTLLEKYGGYEKDENGETDGSDSDEDLATTDDAVDENDDSDTNDVSYLSSDAMMLYGSLDGNRFADREDWKDVVTSCKTLSRLATIVEVLSKQATPLLKKLAKDRDRLHKAIEYWEGNKSRNRKARNCAVGSKKKEKFNSSTEIWTNTTMKEEFVMGKVEGYPWWPARKCLSTDIQIASSLKSLDRTLISFVGEQHLHIIRDPDEVRPFSGEVEEDDDLSKYSTEIVKSLKESIDMTRRILRGRGKWEEPPSTIDENSSIVEEKKSAA